MEVTAQLEVGSFHHVGPSGNQTPAVRLGAKGLYQSYLAGPDNLELLTLVSSCVAQSGLKTVMKFSLASDS